MAHFGFIAIAAAVALVACADQGPAQPAAPPPAITASADVHALQTPLVASQLLVGVDRFPLGVLDHNTPVTDATVQVRAFSMAGGSVELRSEADAPFHSDGLEGRGLYVAQLRLESPGQWLAEVSVALRDGTRRTTAVPFHVLTAGTVPSAGQPAPRSHNPTARDVADVADIDSGSPPDDMHTISIADAIAQHRPALVVFATPAFCASATCGPQVHAVQALEPAYRDRLAFIHVEVYQDFRPDPASRTLSPTVREWRLQTEPWVFLIDANGIISAAFEGTAATDELRQAVDRLLA
jgi:hypothetical protein